MTKTFLLEDKLTLENGKHMVTIKEVTIFLNFNIFPWGGKREYANAIMCLSSGVSLQVEVLVQYDKWKYLSTLIK